MVKQAPGVREGTGPAEGSYQAEKFAQGQRQEISAEPAPISKINKFMEVNVLCAILLATF